MVGDTVASLAVSLVSILAGSVVSTEAPQQCSSFCVCDTWYGLQRASCTSRHLYSIDTGAPTDVLALDLSDNVISLLGDYELMDAGYVNLLYLNLSRNSITEIRINAFEGLTNLTVLDLSNNHLYFILPDVFLQSPNLATLKLAHNNFNSNVPILYSPTLMELSLNGCRISELPQNTFNGLANIRRLDLSYNLMIQMSSMVLQPLQRLKKISLEGNPWSCNKPMFDLQVDLEKRNIQFKRICGADKPKMFEKMIIAPQQLHPKPSNRPSNRFQSPSNRSTQMKHPNLDTNTPSICENNGQEIHSDAYGKHFSSYWLLLIGFITGVACGMFGCYVWLSGAFRCNRRFSFREQRVSRLFDWYLHDYIERESSWSWMESRPDTPPPPYGEVMLRPNFYRYPSTASNFNDNATGYR
ncbi:uncharacterized protein LOC100876618 [Megachile rotundata]|uniref:uncharacterized protein LOC100876618 n=1 Tax=Megachile rotundata TaxID=143995 RepID=UPI003FD26B4C